MPHSVRTGFCACHRPSGSIREGNLQFEGIIDHSTFIQLMLNLQSRLLAFNTQRLDKESPRVKGILLTGHHQFDGTVDTATGIPAVALFLVLQSYRQVVFQTFAIEIGGHINDEGVVAVGPMSSLVTIDIDMRVGHGTVENQLDMFIFLGHGECGPVVALTNPRQGARASRLLGGHVLAIFLDSNDLQVPFLVKRPVDGPVVGNGDILPIDLVARELPIIAQRHLAMALCHCGNNDKYRYQGEYLSHCCFSCWLIESIYPSTSSRPRASSLEVMKMGGNSSQVLRSTFL